MPDDTFYRNSEGDEMLFVHEGAGIFESNFGPMRYGPGDYIVIPIGTTWRLNQDAGSDHRILYVESPVGDRAAQALSQRVGPAARALALFATATFGCRKRLPRTTRAVTSVHVQDARAD